MKYMEILKKKKTEGYTKTRICVKMENMQEWAASATKCAPFGCYLFNLTENALPEETVYLSPKFSLIHEYVQNILS